MRFDITKQTMQGLNYKLKTKNLPSFFIFIMIALLMINDIFSLISFSLIDEIECLLIISFFVIYAFLGKKIYFVNLALPIILMILVGIISSLINFSNIGYKNMILDLFLIIKPYTFFFLPFLFSYDKFEISLLRLMSKFMIIVMFLCCMVFIFTHKYFVSQSGDYGFLSSFQGTIANWSILFIVLILSNKKKYNYLYAIMAAIIIISTNSGLGLLGLLLIIYFFFINEKIKTNIFIIILIIIVALLLSIDEIEGYLLNTSAPRSKMYIYSFITALRYFPLGSGFGTFGSVISASDYSYLYIEYGFSSFYGMSKNYPVFLYDTYYPMIIGQFGFIGFILFILFILMIFRFINSRIIDTRSKNSLLVLLFYFLAMGLGFFISSAGSCAYLLIFGLLMNKYKKYS